jgi:hypothetical protein
MTPAEIFGLVALIGLGLILLFAIRVRLDGLQIRIAAVTRVEAKLDLLLKHANIKFDPFLTCPTTSSRRCVPIEKLRRQSFIDKQPASASKKRKTSSKRCSDVLA